MRVQSPRQKTLKSGEVGWLHTVNGAPAPEPKDRPRPEPAINVGKILNGWLKQSGYVYTKLVLHARELGVSVESVVSLDCCWAQPHRAFCWPMRDGEDNLVGLRLRSESGQKWAVRGSHQGIFIPRAMPHNTCWIVEGPTDCAAALTIGLYAIGRPSCSGGMRDIPVALKRLGCSRAVIVADNDGPGLRGAEMLAEHLSLPTATMVLPCKDMREYVRCGGTGQLLECMLNNLVWKVRKHA